MIRLRTSLLLALAALCLGVVGFSSASFSAGSDNAGNTFSAAADFVAPTPTLTDPADGLRTQDTKPTFSGSAGTAAGDSSTVKVNIYSGSTATGTPVETLTTTASAGSWSVDSAGLVEGTYTARAEQDDSGANTGFSAAHTFTVDTTGPFVSLTAPADGLSTQDTTPTFSGSSGTATGDSDPIEVKVYAGSTATGTPVETLNTTASSGTWSVDSAGLAEGTYTARAEQDDSVSNTGFSFPSTFTIDTTAPTGVTLVTPADGSRTNDPTPTLSGAAGDATGDNAAVQVKIYNGTDTGGTVADTLSATRTGTSWSVDASTLAEGTYTAQAEQSDVAGNGPTASSASTFTVDTTGPTVTLLTPPADTNDTTPAFSGDAGDVTGDTSTVTVKVYSGADTSGSLLQTLNATRTGATWTIDASPALSEGTYTAQAEQSDAAGNSTSSSTRTFTVDTSAPVGVTVNTPTDGTQTNDTTPTLSGDAGNVAGDNDTVQVKVYDGTDTAGSVAQTLNATRTGSTWTIDASALAEGTYTVQATQGDAAGNTSAASNANTFVVDTTSPGVTLTTPANNSRTNDTTPTLSGAAGNATGDNAAVQVKIYNGTGTGGTVEQTLNATRAGSSWTVDASTLAEGTYTAQATQGDAAGNSGGSSTNTFVVDTTAPTGVTVTTPADGTSINDPKPTVSGAASNATGDNNNVQVKMYNGTGTGGTVAQSFTANRSGTTWSGKASTLAEGTYTVQATQGDAAGNTSAVSNANTFTVDSVAPSVSATISASSGGNPTVNGFVRQGGKYIVYANATDSGSGVNTVSASVVNLTTGASNVPLAHDATGVTVGGTTYHYVSAEQTANGSLTAGSKSYTVTATDNATNSSSPTFNVTVDNTGPTVSLTDPATFLNGTVSLSATATDSAGVNSVTVQYTTAGGSTWTDICTDSSSPYACSLDTTTLAEGLYDLRAISGDGLGNASTSTTRTNKRIDRTGPTFTTFSIAPAGTLSGTATLSGAPTDGGGGVASVLFQVAPAGSGTWSTACSDSTSPYSCTFGTTTLADGSYDFRATATDNNGNATTAPTQTRTVDNPIRGLDVQANNGNNQPGTGDTLTLSFNQPPSSTSILGAWDGTSKVVNIRFNEGSGSSSPDTITVLDGATTVGLGTIALNADFIDGSNGDTFTFPGTMVLSGNALTLAITGSGSGSGGSVNAAGTAGAHNIAWTPASTIKDTSNNSINTTQVTETGTTDADF